MKKLFDVYWTAQYSTVVEIEYDENTTEREIEELLGDEISNIDPETDSSNCYVSESFEVKRVIEIEG